jgi:basic membrane lipoprotein Med (substrate-binding protein (PBP1-ABC) superfamily)
MLNIRIFCATVLMCSFAVPAMAEDATPLTVLETSTKDMMKGLDENKTKQFSAINNSFGIIRSIEDAQQSIARAVDSCSASNPNLKDAISTRFESWKDNVRPVMKKARTKLDKMILLQGFAQPSEVRAYLKKFDAAIIYRNQKLKPVPITSAEDCQKLQSSMDASQSNLVNLITETLALNEELKIKEE